MGALERSAEKSELALHLKLAYRTHMSNIELSQFTLREKLQIMESIWEDLRGHVDHFGVPQSHKDILDERRRRIESGKAQILRWDDVKNSIGKR